MERTRRNHKRLRRFTSFSQKRMYEANYLLEIHIRYCVGK